MNTRLAFLTATIAVALSREAAGGIIWTLGTGPEGVVETFEEFNPPPAGTQLPITRITGASISGAFEGQTFADAHPEVLSGTIASPLELLDQGNDQNLFLFDYRQPPSFDIYDGVGLLGMITTTTATFYDGSVAFLFEIDQTTFGLDLFGVDGFSTNPPVASHLYASFYSRTGALINHVPLDVTIATPTDPDTPVTGYFTSDIPFAGVVLTNNDQFGYIYDNLSYAPEPTTGSLIGLGLLALGRRLRRRG